MRAATRKLLDALESVTWFHNVGKGGDSAAAVFVQNWSAAIRWCSAESWEDARANADNEISRQLPKLRSSEWNPLVVHIRPFAEELVEAKVLESNQRIPKFKDVLDTAKWDILSACMEWEYDDVIKTRFYRDAADWYLKGHFPCGYDELEEKHIVY